MTTNPPETAPLSEDHSRPGWKTQIVPGRADHLARGRFLADIAAGFRLVVPATDADFHRAQQLLVRHGLGRSLRTPDALQLAVALGLSGAAPARGDWSVRW
jgi:hypothetical protein